jgi:multiple sugar transport system substrate-binding protein
MSRTVLSMVLSRIRHGVGAYALFILGSCCLAATAWDCHRGSASDRVVEFWAMGREGEVARRLMPEFERRNPDVRVRVQQIPWSAAHEKLLTAFVGDTMPDVFQVGTTWLAEFAALNAAEPLNDRIERSRVVVADDYFPGVVDASTVGSALFGVPWYVDTRLLFYRTDMLAEAGYPEPPRSWAAWADAMARVQARQGSERYALLLPRDEWEMPVILALQLGARLLRDDDQWGNFRSNAFRKAFEFYLDLFGHQFAPRTGMTQIANLYQDFAGGAFCFYVTGPWNIGEFRRRLPPSLEGRWATAPMPDPDDVYPGVSIVGGASLAIFRGSTHKDAAWKMIEYLSEPAQQVQLYRLTGDLPARVTAWEDPALRDDPAARSFRVQLQRVRSTPRIPEWEQIAQKIAEHAEAAIRGAIDGDQALAALDRDVDRLLEKRRWLMRRAKPQTGEDR